MRLRLYVLFEDDRNYSLTTAKAFHVIATSPLQAVYIYKTLVKKQVVSSFGEYVRVSPGSRNHLGYYITDGEQITSAGYFLNGFKFSKGADMLDFVTFNIRENKVSDLIENIF